MSATKWLDRSIAHAGPYMALCFSEREFLQACKKIKANTSTTWLNDGADSTAHHFRNRNGLAVIVCIGDVSGKTGTQIAALLVHEAVHVWQEYCALIGESLPGNEQEAYGIQNISQTLMEEYARRML